MINERIAITCGLAAVALWSTVATGFKLGLAVLEPLQLLCIGSAISLVFFAVALAATGRARMLGSLTPAMLVRLGALGLLNPFLYYIILFEAYDRLPAQIAQPLNYTWAITLALLAIPILRQRLSGRSLVGIGVSYGGVVVLLAGSASSNAESPDVVGITLALVSTLVWATYWLATVRLSVDPITLMFVSFSVGAPAVAIACAATVGIPQLNADVLLYGSWVGLVEMGITFLLWHTALARTAHTGRIAQLIFLSPFLSLVLIDRVLGEAVRATSVLGLVLIVSGLLLTRTEGNPHNTSA